MSVDFLVKRHNGGEAWLPFAGQRTAEDLLVPLARELGLELAPYLYSFFAVDADNVRQMAGELRVLLARVKADYPDSVTLAESIKEIIEELDRLSNETGWTAQFG